MHFNINIEKAKKDDLQKVLEEKALEEAKKLKLEAEA